MGLTIGFTALLKQTFKLKADIESINTRLKQFFGSSKKIIIDTSSLEIFTKPITAKVDLDVKKFDLPKESITVPVDFNLDKLKLPKEQLTVPVDYSLSKLKLPKEQLTVPVDYKISDLNLVDKSLIGVLDTLNISLTKTEELHNKNVKANKVHNDVIQKTSEITKEYSKNVNNLTNTYNKLNTSLQKTAQPEIKVKTEGIDAIKVLREEFNLSDFAAKSVMVTIGKFGQSLGQSKEIIQGMSLELSKAAANFAAYTGASTTDEIIEVAKKFGKATLGETGELKDIGIFINTASQGFINLTKSIQATTGASAEQAKQLAIAKEIIAQTEYMSGSAAGAMFDGFTQLNNVLDNFKSILGKVGEIFSDVFGPALKLVNGFLELPFVKSTTAWVIAIGSVTAAYLSIHNILNKISKEITNVVKHKNDEYLITDLNLRTNRELNNNLKMRSTLLRNLIAHTKTLIKTSRFK